MHRPRGTAACRSRHGASAWWGASGSSCRRHYRAVAGGATTSQLIALDASVLQDVEPELRRRAVARTRSNSPIAALWRSSADARRAHERNPGARGCDGASHDQRQADPRSSRARVTRSERSGAQPHATATSAARREGGRRRLRSARRAVAPCVSVVRMAAASPMAHIVAAVRNAERYNPRTEHWNRAHAQPPAKVWISRDSHSVERARNAAMASRVAGARLEDRVRARGVMVTLGVRTRANAGDRRSGSKYWRSIAPATL